MCVSAGEHSVAVLCEHTYVSMMMGLTHGSWVGFQGSMEGLPWFSTLSELHGHMGPERHRHWGSLGDSFPQRRGARRGCSAQGGVLQLG